MVREPVGKASLGQGHVRDIVTPVAGGDVGGPGEGGPLRWGHSQMLGDLAGPGQARIYKA